MPSYPLVLIYMLQGTEYNIGEYFAWLHRTKDFTAVIKRRSLEPTKAAKVLLLVLRIGMTVQILTGLLLVYFGWRGVVIGGQVFGIALILSYPIVWAYLIILPLIFGQWFVNNPNQRKIINQSQQTFAAHKAIIIAVAGSYGKTTMKEILTTVLGEGLKVAATPANKNVSISHARFARHLKGDEDVIIIEYGEGEPGDVARFAQNTKPTHGVITGLSPAHLDQYKTLEAAGNDIFALADYLKGKQVYVNNESPDIKRFLKSNYEVFNPQGAMGWKVENIKTDLTGTSFVIKKAKKSLNLNSKLIGQHQVGYLAFVAALALKLGLNEKQVRDGVAKTAPFEHRMQPYRLAEAWVVDDTYNGNLEGIRAGTQLLGELKAKRKIYVTPGLVDQGEETKRVHEKIGELIADAKPDVVILMKNSVTDFIKLGLKKADFKGELRIESDPLEFYTNLKHFVASGDLVVMQNDWTDNYA